MRGPEQRRPERPAPWHKEGKPRGSPATARCCWLSVTAQSPPRVYLPINPMGAAFGMAVAIGLMAARLAAALALVLSFRRGGRLP